jgi:hypothetical protein
MKKKAKRKRNPVKVEFETKSGKKISFKGFKT